MLTPTDAACMQRHGAGEVDDQRMGCFFDERGGEIGSVEFGKTKGAVNRESMTPSLDLPDLDTSTDRTRPFASTDEKAANLSIEVRGIADFDELIVKRENDAWHGYIRPPSPVAQQANCGRLAESWATLEHRGRDGRAAATRKSRRRGRGCRRRGGVVVVVVVVVVTGTEAAAWAGTIIDCTTGRVHFDGSTSVAIAAPPTAIPFRTRLRSGFSCISPPNSHSVTIS